MSSILRVAVVGLGVGKSHVQAFQSLPDMFDVVAVCDIDGDKARSVARSLNVAHVCTDLADVCCRADVDVIDLCTPPALHYRQVQQVLAAGKHCICEKPLVGSLREVDELVVAEARSGRRVMPIFQYRFGHGLQKLKLLQERGLTGRAYLSTVEVAWRRRAEYYAVPWRGRWDTELGGTITGHAVHAIDMLTYAIGPVRSVFARTATLVHPIEVEDTASLSMEMTDGSLASVSVTVGSSVEITRHRFCFSNLVAESNTRPYTNSHEPWTFVGDTPELQERIDQALAAFVPLPERFPGQFYRFHQALQAGTELPVTLRDARAAIELLTAIYRSALTGQVVMLPLGKDEGYDGWTPQASLVNRG